MKRFASALGAIVAVMLLSGCVADGAYYGGGYGYGDGYGYGYGYGQSYGRPNGRHYRNYNDQDPRFGRDRNRWRDDYGR